MSDRTTTDMAPDSQTLDIAGSVDLIASMTITSPTSASHHYSDTGVERSVVITSPLPNGILFKGKSAKKRVSFRDSQLVNIREIPPRSSSGDEDSDEDEAAGSSESEESDSESGEDEVSPQPVPVVVNISNNKPNHSPSVSRTFTSPTPTILSPSSSLPMSTVTVRPERAPIPWTPMSSFTGAKGSYSVAVSPAAKVMSLVSRITGVSAPSSQIIPKPRNTTNANSSSSNSAATAASTSASSDSTSSQTAPPARKTSSPVPPKKSPSAVRVEKKVKKITPTLDNVMTSQTVRSVQKHGAVSETLHKGSGVKTGRKKRTSQRRQEASDKRKAIPKTKNAKDSKQSSNSNSTASKQSVSGKRTVSSAGARPKSVTNGFGHVKDSLSLPPLSSDDSALPNPSRQPQHRPVSTKSTVYSVDGFIFPGDPSHELKSSPTTSGTGDTKAKGQGCQSTPASGLAVRETASGQPVKDRVNSAPAGGSVTRRKRFYAWQMANGNLQNSLHEPPSITPMWESITTMSNPIPKPAYVADR